MRAAVNRVKAERQLLSERVVQRGGSTTSSQANFVLAEFPDARWVWEALASLGIAARSFPGRRGLESRVRIALPGDDSALEFLLSAMDAVLAPEALLFDLDGVIADVSSSYRVAIVRTAASYGVALTLEDVALAKAAGGCNNDWELTARLLRDHGVDAPLADVTGRFEAFYQGTSESPGLRLSERLLVPREHLERLSSRLPLGIVTGRPRDDAVRFIEEQEIGDLISGVVSMEDAPLKPDPAPVRLALARLGVKRAWMLGDTPDDVVAARSAGVVPIGAAFGAGATASLIEALTQCGAARVITDIGRLEAMLETCLASRREGCS
jgi:HAD superfamily hydrolase (TIGR01548 family)